MAQSDPTWRDLIVEAAMAPERAFEYRQKIFRKANDAGISMGEIAKVSGMSKTGVHKIIGTGRHQSSSLLDSPVPRS